jgi:tyrosyl-tRNA synthetase
MAHDLDAATQAKVLQADATTVVSPEDLRRKLDRSLAEGRPLRVKLGIDPSRPDLHLGHAVVLRKLRQFQDLGHTAVLIIGDYTGLVGDPSGQSETRPMLSPEEMAANAETYFDQAGLVLDVDRAEVRRNSEWLAPMTMADVIRLTGSYTVARMLERDDFQARYQEGRPISVSEFLYPLMQAKDSVAVRADVELGGTDQTFNLLVGRHVQRDYGQEEQVVLTLPLLEGTDGVRKMSKSYDNAVGLTEDADSMFGKLMRIPDELIGRYVRLATTLGPREAAEIEAGLAAGTRHPNEEKRAMARSVVDLYRGPGAGKAAEERFDRVHRERLLPEEVEDRALPASATRGGGTYWLPGVLSGLGLASSNSEARRLIAQGGVRLDGDPVTDPDAEWRREDLVGKTIQVGRRRFVRLSG